MGSCSAACAGSPREQPEEAEIRQQLASGQQNSQDRARTAREGLLHPPQPGRTPPAASPRREAKERRLWHGA